VSPTSTHAAGRRAITNTALRAVGELSGKLGTFVLFAVLARQLGQDAVGTFVVAFAYVQVVTIMIDLGFDRVVIRRVAVDLAAMPRLIADIVGFKLLFAIPVTALSWALAAAIGYPYSTRVAIALLSVGLLLDSLNRTIDAVMAARERSGVLSVSVVVQRVSGAVLGIAAIATGHGVWAVCIAYATGSAIGLVTAVVLMSRYIGRPAFVPHPRHWPGLVRESAPFAIYDSLGFLLTKTDTIVLSLLASHAAVGLYGAASRLYESSFAVTYSINGAFIAMFTYLSRTSVPTVGTMYGRALKLALVLLVPLATVLMVEAEPVSVLLFGEDFRGTAGSLRALAPAIVLMAFVSLSASIVAQRTGTRPLLGLTAGVLVTNIALTLLLVPAMGAPGAGLAMTLTLAVFAVGAMRLASREVGRPPLAQTLAAPLLAGLVMAGVMSAIGALAPSLLAGVPAFVAVFWIAERLIAPEELRHLTEVLRGLTVPGAFDQPVPEPEPVAAPAPEPVAAPERVAVPARANAVARGPMLVRSTTLIARSVLRRRPLVLCYHGIGVSPRADDPEYLRVDPARFRAHVEILAEAGATFTTLADLAARARSGPLPAGLVAITFDDGYQDNHDIALPILQELGVTGTIFVATGLIGKPNPWMRPGSGLRMMHPSELHAVAAAGFELGAHTISHPDLTAVDADTCRHEVAGSKEQLEAILGTPVTSFAYPYFLYDATARAAAEAAGFDAAVTGLGWGGFDDRLALPRALVGGKDGLTSFALRITGRYDPMFRHVTGAGLRVVTRPVRRLARHAIEMRRR
jgi:O-antigen/teichoic acid export membrane protein/peptidoglycan/xylan/chitin deacetylase (PgdA/CDA1 family)